MKLVRRYDYPSMRRRHVDGLGRHYEVDGRSVPSVTTVLYGTKDDRGLEAWRRRVGVEEAERISREARTLGTALHETIEAHVLDRPPPEPTDEIARRGIDLASVVIERALAHVQEIWGSEVNLYYPDLYAGTADMVGVYNGRPTIMDFKTSRRPKMRGWIGDYFLQLVAYARAHDVLFGTRIRHGVIWMVSYDGTFQEFQLEGEDFEAAERQWLARLAAWYAIHGGLPRDELPAQVRPAVDRIVAQLGRDGHATHGGAR